MLFPFTFSTARILLCFLLVFITFLCFFSLQLLDLFSNLFLNYMKILGLYFHHPFNLLDRKLIISTHQGKNNLLKIQCDDLELELDNNRFILDLNNQGHLLLFLSLKTNPNSIHSIFHLLQVKDLIFEFLFFNFLYSIFFEIMQNVQLFINHHQVCIFGFMDYQNFKEFQESLHLYLLKNQDYLMSLFICYFNSNYYKLNQNTISNIRPLLKIHQIHHHSLYLLEDFLINLHFGKFYQLFLLLLLLIQNLYHNIFLLLHHSLVLNI